MGLFVFCLLVFLLVVGGVAVFSVIFSKSVGRAVSVGVERPSILYVDLSRELPESHRLWDFDFSLGDFEEVVSPAPTKHQMYRIIEQAAQDTLIRGLFLRVSDAFELGFQSADYLAGAIDKFRAAGKPVYAWGNVVTQNAYALAVHADSVFLMPGGLIELRGFAVHGMFLKRLMDWLGVRFRVFRAEEFKTAADPLVRTSFSREDRVQLEAVVSEWGGRLLSHLRRRFSQDTSLLNVLIDTVGIADHSRALALALADAISTEQEALRLLAVRCGLDTAEIPIVKAEKYMAATASRQASKKDVIAVVVAQGPVIREKERLSEAVSSATLVRWLQRLDRDAQVKAVVLRVVSPGGDIYASEEIYRQVRQMKKPVVVSMGAVAGSGGYYISAPADYIVAEPTTITGSIGVVMAVPDASGLVDRRLRLDFESIKTHQLADMGSIYRSLTPAEERLLSRLLDVYYSQFIERVAEARGLPPDSVRTLAKGRIWMGTRAWQLGIVDTVGYLPDAVERAAALAGIKEYSVRFYPEENIYSLVMEMIDERNDFHSMGTLFSTLPYPLSGRVRWNGLFLWLNPHTIVLLWKGEPLAIMPQVVVVE